MKRIILASASPRRKDILQMFDLHFDVITSDADEHVNGPVSPSEFVSIVASRKGQAVRDSLRKQGVSLEDTLIISSDTIVAIDDMILGKPCDEDDAKSMLMRLQGRTNTVYSGLHLIYNNQEYTSFAATDVLMRAYSEKEVDDYVASKDPLGKAGSYGIQGIGGALVASIQGDYYNVVGFPLPLFQEMLLKHFHVGIFDLKEVGK